jgi:5'-nucleotidase
MAERKGDWIQLISGEPFWPLDARLEEVHLNDIAWALSMQCRYAGHVKRRYSVGEHSVMVSRLVPAEHALWGLLHDASEAYLVDLPRPVKHSMPDYCAYEDALMRVIAERFDLPWPEPWEVKQVDRAMLSVERRRLLAESRLPWGDVQGGEWDTWVVGMDEMDLPCWSPTTAYNQFVQRYAEVTGIDQDLAG